MKLPKNLKKRNKRKNKKKNFFQFFSIAILTLFGLFLGFFLSNKVGKNLKNLFFSPPLRKNFIASIIEKKGEVFLKSKNEVDFKPLKESLKSLYTFDRIQTKKNSSLTLEFSSKYEIKILEMSSIKIEWWKENTPPAYIYFSSGDYNLITQGQKGDLFILKNGKLFIPSERPNVQEQNLFLITKNLETKALSSISLKHSNSSSDDHLVSDQQRFRKEALDHGSTHLDIEPEISKIYKKLKKCQWNALRKKEPSQGEILLGLNIKSTGEIKNIKIFESSFKHSHIESCVISAFKRLQFKPRSSEVYKVYPLQFE